MATRTRLGGVLVISAVSKGRLGGEEIVLFLFAVVGSPDEVGGEGQGAVDDGDECCDAANDEKEPAKTQIRPREMVLRRFNTGLAKLSERDSLLTLPSRSSGSQNSSRLPSEDMAWDFKGAGRAAVAGQGTLRRGEGDIEQKD